MSDKLDRMEERSRMSLERGLGEWVRITADDVLALVAVACAARDPGIRRDLLWMAEGRRKGDRKHTDEFLAALARLEEA